MQVTVHLHPVALHSDEGNPPHGCEERGDERTLPAAALLS